MISEDGKVSMIDIGSIIKHGDEISIYSVNQNSSEFCQILLDIKFVSILM